MNQKLMMTLIIAISFGLNAATGLNEAEVSSFFLKMGKERAAHSLSNSTPLAQVIAQFQKLDRFANKNLEKLTEKLEEGESLNGHDLFFLRQTITNYFSLYNELNEKQDLFPKNLKPTADFFSGTSIEEKIEDLEWLLARLVFLNSAIDRYNQIYVNKSLRRVVKNIFRTNEYSGQNLSSFLEVLGLSIEKKSREDLNEKFKKFELYKSSLESSSNKTILELISRIHALKDNSALIESEKKIKAFKFADSISRKLSNLTNSLSKVFGNSAGKVRWRHGHFYGDKELQKEFEKILKPLDLIAEKTPFALTDTFIPGHYGHIAIWLGSKKQLQEIGMWDHPVIKPIQKNIEEGRVILEALRPGVQMNTLAHFMEIDEIGIFRQPDILNNKVEMANVYKRAINQFEKEYDFNFDVTTTDKIVCSELAYHAFGNIEWPLNYVLGRSTISPDNVAELLFYKNSPIEFVYAKKAEGKERNIIMTKSDLAEKLGYVFNEERSKKLGYESYDKKIKECRTIGAPLGNHRRSNHVRHKRVCTTKLVEQVYLP